MLNFILFTALVLILVSEIASYFTYGKFVDNEIWSNRLLNHYKKGVRLNPFSEGTMLYVGNLPYITVTPPSLLSKYHIDDQGRVLRWSKTHEIISQYFEEAKDLEEREAEEKWG